MDSEILDDFEIEKKTELISKSTIFIVCILLSPIIGGILYCINLNRNKQIDKIIGTFIAIVVCNFLATVPFLGFRMESFPISPFDFIHHFVMALLMIFPLWNKHFENLNYKPVFPFTIVLISVLIIVSLIYFNIGVFTFVNLFLLLLLVRFLYILVRPKKVVNKTIPIENSN